MWNWLQQNAELLAALGNMFMVLIWVIYLQLFYRQYSRQQRPHLVIHHAQGHALSANCLLVNMSKEPVHVQAILAQVETEEERRRYQITDYRRVSPSEPHVERAIRQGPLQPGDFLMLGSFQEILDGRTSRAGARDEGEEDGALPLEKISTLAILVAVSHGPSDRPVGARRRFAVAHRDGRSEIRPLHLHTDQFTSQRAAPEVQQWQIDCLTPQDVLDGSRN